MSEHNITVDGGSSVRLKTAGKYCDRDIVVTSTGGKEDVTEEINDYTAKLATLEGAIGELEAELEGKASVGEYEVYEGSYKVTPSVSSQSLGTANKLMQSDVLVEGIPYAEVTNNFGGKTVTIA